MDEDTAARAFAAGYEAFARDDYAAAHAAWEPLAAAGMAKAQFYLGYLHQCGHGAPQSYHRARDYYRMAAEKGDAGAQYALGNLFYFGQGTAKNRAEAAKWFRMAALQGHRDAQYNLGDIFARGLSQSAGEPQDDLAAAQWYEMAAHSGDGAGQEKLAQMYLEGRGAVRDLVRAYAWFMLAIAKGNSGAQTGLDTATQAMTADDIAMANALARTIAERSGQPGKTTPEKAGS